MDDDDARANLKEIKHLVVDVRNSMLSIPQGELRAERWKELLSQYSVIVNQLDRLLDKIKPWLDNYVAYPQCDTGNVVFPELLRTRRIVELENADCVQVQSHFEIDQINHHNNVCRNMELFFDTEKKAASSVGSSPFPTPQRSEESAVSLMAPMMFGTGLPTYKP